MLVFSVGGRRFRRHLRFTLVGLAIFAVAVWPFADLSRNLVYAVSNVKKLLPVYSVDTAEKKVAISFDACWGAEQTPQILAVLDQYRVKTTFFLVNVWLKDYPEYARRIVQAGHEVGLHSTTHPHFTQLSEEQIVSELQQNHKLLKEITGSSATLFRPPYGDYNNKVVQVVQGLGYVPVQWSVDSLDWKGLSAGDIYQRVVPRVKNGSIVLFHNDGRHTVEALGPILAKLQREGYEVVPVSQLIYRDNFYIDINGIQHQVKP